MPAAAAVTDQLYATVGQNLQLLRNQFTARSAPAPPPPAPAPTPTPGPGPVPAPQPILPTQPPAPQPVVAQPTAASLLLVAQPTLVAQAPADPQPSRRAAAGQALDPDAAEIPDESDKSVQRHAIPEEIEQAIDQ